MSLAEFSIHRPVTVLMACLIAMLLGTISFIQIPVDLMPEMEYPTISVTTVYEGGAPEEMETLISRPLEQSLASAPGTEEITSSSSEGNSRVRVRFVYGTNLDEAANELRERIDRRRNLLPEDIEPPVMYKFDVSQFPIMFLSVASDTMDAKQLRHYAEKNLQYRLERTPGVAQTRVSGGLRRQIHVYLDLKKIRALNLSVAQVVQTLRRENLNRPVGPVFEGRYEVLLRTQGEFENLQDILNVAVATRNGVPVYIRDIATVEDSHEDIRYIVRVNGESAVRMYIYKQSGANTVQVSEGVWREVDKIHAEGLPVRMESTWDSANFIRASISNVNDAALAGAGLAIFVLLFFLRSFSSMLIIGVAIPISVISTFALMYFNGFTLNTVSFGGLALGVGMLVDNGIVVLENIFRHREGGKNLKAAAVLGSRQVGMAITASTLTTIAVFVPVLFMGGVSAQQFQQLAWVVSFALLCSLIMALTVVPVLCSRFLTQDLSKERRGLGGALYRWTGSVQNRWMHSYTRALEWSLDHRVIVVVLAVGLFTSSYYLMPFIGVELQPEVDEGQIRIELKLEPGTRVEVTDDTMMRITDIVNREVPEAAYIMTEAGSSSTFRFRGGNEGRARIDLVDQSQRDRSAADVANTLRPLLNLEPGMIVRTRVSSGLFRRRGSGFGEGDDRLSVEVRGHDIETIRELSEQVRETMTSIPGVVSAQLSRLPGVPEMLISVDRAKASSLGLSVTEVADTLETAIGGTRASLYREEGDEYDILVRLREEDRLELGQVNNIPITLPDGSTIPIESVVRMKRQEGPTEITRADQQRIIEITGTIAERDLGSVVTDLRAGLAQIPRPADGDYEFRLGGEYEEQQEAFRQLTLAALLALILVYMVMAAQFESLRDPFIILFSIPLAGIGVVLMLLLTETTFNMQGFLGVIVLVGIVVNNAIVLVDYTNLLRRKHGHSLRDAVVTAGGRRLRPILMTTVTTVLGLSPMALGLGEGGELQAPMARVVIGGLTTSTLITLVFIPVIYFTLESWSEKLRARRTAAVPAPSTLHPAGSAGD
ncbi:MAG: efflux RND transporter permease subunit [Bryobacterales bacterium]|nr:efflux RND transporter permease subunit [Bryobacterales bacterium]MDE0296440.1 efflux RND transporter permease subunit [Bryobacterales bacterium]MDE0435536.1 efflux RND transporter permease subunit [Bryobacterales bacterium]